MYKETINTVARYVHGKGLSVPAIFVLELHKPLTGLANAALLAGRPVLHTIFGRNKFQGLEEILESSERVEELIVAIESLDAESRKGRACKE